MGLLFKHLHDGEETQEPSASVSTSSSATAKGSVVKPEEFNARKAAPKKTAKKKA